MVVPAGLEVPPGADPERYAKAIQIVAARQRLIPFVRYTMPDYHVSRAHHFLAGKLEAFEQAVKERKSPRLMVFLPPRFGKSQLCSRHFPAWLLGRNPDWNVGIVSYGAELAEELSADARRLFISDEYAEVFGARYAPEPGSSVELDRSSKAVNHWRVAGHRGGVRAVGVGGALTGRGFDVLDIDDPIKGREEADSQITRDSLWKFWQGTLRPRMEPGGGILWVQTPWHHDEASARLAEVASDKWEVIRLPALAEEDDPLGRAPGEPLDPLRFPVEELLALRDDPDGVSARDWSAQYQQKPTPDEGDKFKRAWFQNVPDPEAEGQVLQYWDTAHGKANPKRKGDRSVCSTWRRERNKYRCIGLWVGRPDYPSLKRKAIELREHHHARAIIIEDHSSGQSLIQDLRNDTRIPVLPWKTGNESKEQRASAAAVYWEAGTAVMSLPEHLAQMVVEEHMHFPNGRYDDIVDSCSMAIAHLAVWNAPARRRVRLREFRAVA